MSPAADPQYDHDHLARYAADIAQEGNIGSNLAAVLSHGMWTWAGHTVQDAGEDQDHISGLLGPAAVQQPVAAAFGPRVAFSMDHALLASTADADWAAHHW